MRQRKSWLFVIALLTLVVLVACGQSESSSSTDGGAGGSVQNGNDNGNSSVAQDVEPIELTFASVWPATHAQNIDIVQPFLEEIERVTEGRVTAKFYPSEALGPTTEQHDMVVTGVADMSIGLHGYTPGVFPLSGVTELPFMGENAVDGTRIFNELFDKFPEFEEEHGDVKVAWVFKVDTAQIMTTDKPVRKPEDMEGLKLRTPNPASNALVEAFGSIPVHLPMGETYEAMQRGVVDGAMAPPSVIANFQLADVTKYITRLNFYSSSAYAVINKNTWDKISPQDQEALEALFEEMSYRHAEGYDNHADVGWQAAEEGGVEIIEIPEEELPLWIEKVEHIGEEWVKEMEQQGLPGRAIYEEAIRLR